ncbi:hypothetical protein COHA_002050 [Chlorella ohadii]|uniref:shikimate dehydrogenase (NADP(+)) n=1 Tax=Chlorella ohadii TaxID=2649997 RepID=A0AAD5H8X1_9CHLO|nr:hypothetical protein COHA_002050 [Chlorella ohadii]
MEAQADAGSAAAAAGGAADAAARTHLCTSLVATSVDGMLAEAQEAVANGADIVELRLDYLEDFDAERDLPRLVQQCPLPAIATYRPVWEGGKYDGPEAPRLAALRLAAQLGVAYVDIELKVATVFFAAKSELPATTKIIVSSHDYEKTASDEELRALVERCYGAGADIVKFATMANDITDAWRVLSVLRACPVPCIALAMGERGQISRLLAPKYGGFLTFGALSPERASAPGQPTLQQLSGMYGLKQQRQDTAVMGIVGNPVSHSRSPAIHNAALQQLGLNAVYVPLLVDDMARFLATFTDADWIGFSVTIPHKQAALEGAQEVDPVAAQIGAVNTLVRQEDGSLKGYNTDWSAAIAAIERGLDPATPSSTDASSSPLAGKTVVVVGAGGAGRALAFGAAVKGAKVVIANRSVQKAADLAAQLDPPASACSLEDLASGAVRGDVLANTTSVGMHLQEDETPVPAAALPGFQLVFDAVYTPLHTRLLKEAAAAGCTVVTGETMFVGQAADQFKLFTGKDAPVDLMRTVVLDSLAK